MEEKIFSRICPQCKREMFYTKKGNRDYAEKRKRSCNSCSQTGKHKGEKNHFYGKKHSRETVEKILEKTKKFRKERSQTPEFKKWFEENIANRKSVYSIWVEKYGEEKARELQNTKNAKHSENMSGSKNPMFGKPSPIGSGNGWAGWYKGWYFRSLLELSYMVDYIEKMGINWQSGESKKIFPIPYLDRKGKQRNYFVDFVLEGKILVEIKPKKLINSESVQAKLKAGEKFAKENGYEYIIIEPPRISEERIVELYESGLLKFLPRYEIKFKQRYHAKLDNDDGDPGQR